MRKIIIFEPPYIKDGTANVLMHPARFKIIQCLRESSKPLFVDQIAKKTNIHPRMVSHHLDILQERGLIECRYELLNIEGSRRGVAVRLCSATLKTEEALNEIKKAFTIS
jgi:DNA-binding transcriptional ArsR family regulator